MALRGWSLAQAARVLGLPVQRVERLVRRGIVPSNRDAKGRVSLAFTQLVLLQTAARLSREDRPWREIERALRAQTLDMDGLESVHQYEFGFGAQAPVQALLLPEHAPSGPLEPETMNAAEWYVLGQQVSDDSMASARDAYRRALELDPLHREARWALAELLANEDRLEAAERHLQLVELQLGDAEVASSRGRLLFEMDRLEEAEVVLRRAVDLDPDHGSSWLLLGRLYEHQGKKQEALRSLSEFKRLTE